MRVGSRPELAPLTKQATDAPTKLHSRLPSALQSVEEFAEFISWQQCPAQIPSGVIVVDVLDLVFSQRPQAHAQERQARLARHTYS